MTAPVSVAGVDLPQDDQPARVLPARPEALRMKLGETALVVVDMQNAYASLGGYLDLAGFDVSSTGPVIANIKRACAAARAAGMPVIFFQNGWDPDYVEAGGPGSPNWHKSNALKTMRKRPELEGQLLAKGGWDYQLVDELKPEPGDIVVPKIRYSGFFNSSFDSVLRSRGIRNLVFTGIATNVCVESTLRDGFHLEYFGVVLADATHQAGPEFAQQAALFNIETFFGWVSSVDDFCTTFSPFGQPL
ncbi:Peroxyureidoacrylate/ureidoacrylate amidohydrolase RutB [Pseudomonas syringae pv. antirrhini]|uniref:Ureidoacrylate amidohydrolase RutB n=1 Tax=Pseudomonas syringae pv. antirrhini TaxID=251702 RepID=A0A0P9JT48_9PSED|nr:MULTISPECIES: pyrimidine utilization protein B [Pseudomonas]KPW50858.1 Peroxyureidoacrylate/ureidoacrylate amidohydrolase RutB [Pseudomonas syringae pv. antirrhini]RMP38840.1 Peroxyureidoacrylate/ureidoacrylate amidohydrolase RutB [Pseudomonas syringae pv. antirrhini]RMP44063.1 Peroxyureidoacrylate/ureidoacrylate amidohydrolase RutB [Pseudomonas syringae pv. antirrhini]RMW21322.1 Peroxyureidoacrylate/ureidoacrylate amidohydrolase RutB [Pseudomonas syringae pv. antirrhini]WIN08247.1 pyrimidi